MESMSGYAGLHSPIVVALFLLRSTVIGEALKVSRQLKQMCPQDVVFSDPCWRHSLERHCANPSKRHNCISQHGMCECGKVQREIIRAFHQITPLRLMVSVANTM